MRRLGLLCLLASLLPAQEGGRDTGQEGRPVVFVRWERGDESYEIWDAAWSALEPHALSRRRLMAFDGDPSRARTLLAENSDAALLVAFGAKAAGAVRESLPDHRLLEVSPGALAQVETRVDRERLAGLVRLLAPEARRIGVFSPRAESLRGYELVPGALEGCDLIWIAEDAEADLKRLRAALAAGGVPLVSTEPDLPAGLATMTVRPDPAGLGRRLAALVLLTVRGDKAIERVGVERLRVRVDLAAAHAAGHPVPLELLARADDVRRRT